MAHNNNFPNHSSGQRRFFRKHPASRNPKRKGNKVDTKTPRNRDKADRLAKFFEKIAKHHAKSHQSHQQPYQLFIGGE